MRIWLLVALLVPFCSAAPMEFADIDKAVDIDDDHVHDESDNAREGHSFTHNYIGLGDLDVSGSVKGHDVSFGHQLEIDVHTHHHHVQDEADCSCNGHLDEHGEGQCNTDWPHDSKQFWCYVKKESCSDAEEWRGNYWSFEACDVHKGSLPPVPFPAYLGVPGFQKCLGTKSEGSSSVWCFPFEKPVACNPTSWEKLMTLQKEPKERFASCGTNTTTTGTPLKKWIGGFPESNPAFAYPNPNLTHFENGSVLPFLDNMENIDKLDLQLAMKWPEFSWETELGKPESRAFVMFAPYISRVGYTVEGRVFSIICPQGGTYSPTLGSLSSEVTVTGQRGWVNQPKRTMAADLTVVAKIWFGPGAKENWLVRLLWHLFELSSLPFPHSKKNAIVVYTHSPDFKDQSFFSARDGESTEFEIPEFAKHPEAWTVANLRAQVGQIKKTGSEVVDTFNQLIIDIYNAVKGNILKENNTLYWNMWFTEPQNVNRTEWRNHAEKWRDSIDTGHGSPYGNDTHPKYFNGTLFNPFKEESPEKKIENELEKILHWLKKYINILNK